MTADPAAPGAAATLRASPGGRPTDAPAAPGSPTGQEALAAAILAIGTPGFVPAAIAFLRAAAPFSGVFVTRLAPGRPPVHIHDDVREERRPRVVEQYLKTAYLLDPFVDACRRDPSNRVLTLAQVAPDRFHRSSYHALYYRTLRLRDEAGVFVRLDDGSTLFCSLGRGPAEPPFGRRDVAALRAALPVFAALNQRHFGGAFRPDPPAPPPGGVEEALARFGERELTLREREIAVLILRGHSTGSAAEMTGIAPGTVKNHRKSIYRKLGVSSQSELFSRFLASVGAPG